MHIWPNMYIWLTTNTTKYNRVQRQRMEVRDESEAVQGRKKTAKKRKKQSPIQIKRKYMREREKSRCRTKYNQMLTSDKQQMQPNKKGL